MKIAVVSFGLDSTGIMYHLAQEEAKVFYWTPKKKIKCLEGISNITRDVGMRLQSFVEKHSNSDFFIFDGSEWGKLQDELRRQGIKVLGSSSLGEVVEQDRIFGYELARKLGVKVPETVVVESIKEAINFLKKNKGRWIVKQSGNQPKTLSWMGKTPTGEDIIYHLEALVKRFPPEKLYGKIVLQRVVEGIEVATSGFMTPNGWLKTRKGVLLELNFEHKGLLEGERGVTTGEMGTVARFIEGENAIFRKMLKPLENVLKYWSNYGPVDANCIWDGSDFYLLEWTIRFGYPISELYPFLLGEIKFTSFLIAMVNGNILDSVPDLWGIVYVLGFPLFPFERVKSEEDSFLGEKLLIPRNISSSFSPGFVSHRTYSDDYVIWEISDRYGYAGTFSWVGNTIQEIQKKARDNLPKVIPSHKGFYRLDIGDRVIEALKDSKFVSLIAGV